MFQKLWYKTISKTVGVFLMFFVVNIFQNRCHILRCLSKTEVAYFLPNLFLMMSLTLEFVSVIYVSWYSYAT